MNLSAICSISSSVGFGNLTSSFMNLLNIPSTPSGTLTFFIPDTRASFNMPLSLKCLSSSVRLVMMYLSQKGNLCSLIPYLPCKVFA